MVRLIENATNIGAAASRNRAIEIARGEYITGLDDDDYFLPAHVKELVKWWEISSDEVVAIYFNAFTKKNNKLAPKKSRLKNVAPDDLLCANWVGNQIFTKTSYLKEIGGFDPDFPAWQDLECWYRLLTKKNAIACLSPQWTYVIDAAHESERISKNYRNVALACDKFIEKNNLKINQKKIVSLQMNYYNMRFPDPVCLFLRITSRKNYQNLRSSVILFWLPFLRISKRALEFARKKVLSRL